MRIELRNGLPFVQANIVHAGQQIQFQNVLIDTGSAGTVFATDRLLSIGIRYEADDTVHRIRGVGGAEFVFAKRIESLTIGDLLVHDFEVEAGLMDYGFEIDGIIGVDFLTAVGAVIDLRNLEVRREFAL